MRGARPAAVAAAACEWESWALLLLLGTRGILALTLDLGRDEYAYWWWAWNAWDASYSLVVGTFLRFATWWAGDAAAVLRTPGWIAGVVTVALVFRLSRSLCTTRRGATRAALAVAASPWQGYVGTVVHPDAFLAAATLAVASALHFGDPSRRLPQAAAAAAFGALAKLSGVLLFAPVAWAILRVRNRRSLGAFAAAAILVGCCAVLVAAQDRTLFTGVLQFGSFPADLNSAGRALRVLGEAAVLAGPALLLMAGAGAARCGRRLGAIPTSIALPFLVVFLGFLLGGRGKGNWFLPALLVFAPWGAAVWESAESRRQRLGTAILAISCGTSLLFGALWLLPSSPEIWQRIVQAPVMANIDSTYQWHVGRREQSVSPTRLWSERFEEYQPAEALERTLQSLDGVPVHAILSDDYGLAFAAAWRMGRRIPVYLPWDPIYARTCGGEPLRDMDVLFLSRRLVDVPDAWKHRFVSLRRIPVDGNQNSLTAILCRGWQADTPPNSTRRKL